MSSYFNKNHTEMLESPETENKAIKNGYRQLSGKEISEKLVGQQFLGSYLHGFQYVISINTDGSLVGKNNYQHHDVGSWVIDMEENTLSVNWRHGWDNTTTRLYELGEEIRMYDKKKWTMEDLFKPKNESRAKY